MRICGSYAQFFTIVYDKNVIVIQNTIILATDGFLWKNEHVFTSADLQ
jgi:hypothetical protein